MAPRAGWRGWATGHWAGLAVAVAIVVLVAIDLSWLDRFRDGYPTDWDESLYMAFALENTQSLRAHGLGELVSTVLNRPTHAPLVPLTAVPIQLVAGETIQASLLTGVAYFALLVSATYALAKRVVSSPWALLAALTIATAPVTTDWSREFHFAVPAAALFTAAVWALLRSSGLRSIAWVLAAGVLLGLAVLARTMTVAYVPGFALAAFALALAGVEDRGRRLAGGAICLGVAAAVAAVWYAPNWDSVSAYLGGAGYGAEAARYGHVDSIASLSFWAQDPGRIAADLYLPLALLLALAVAVAAFYGWRGRGPNLGARLRDWTATPAFALFVIVAVGYLALVSSANQGTAFSLPLLPAAVTLCAAAIGAIPRPLARRGLAGALIAVALLNTVMKSGWLPSLMTPRDVRSQQLGLLPVVDGTGTMQRVLETGGYHLPTPAGRPPALHRRWLPFGRELAGWMLRYADARRRETYALFATRDVVFGTTRLILAGALDHGRTIQSKLLVPAVGADPAKSCGRTLRLARNDFLITADRAPIEASGCREAGIDASARSLGFRPVRSFAMPDGRRMRVWWLDRG